MAGEVRISDDNRWVEVFNDAGVRRMRIIADPNPDEQQATMYDVNGQLAVGAAIIEREPCLMIYDSAERVRAIVFVNPDRALRLLLIDEYGRDLSKMYFPSEQEKENRNVNA